MLDLHAHTPDCVGLVPSQIRDMPLFCKEVLVSCMFHIVCTAETVEEVGMLFVFFCQTVGFAVNGWFAGPTVVSAAIVAEFEVFSRSSHPGCMPHCNLLQISAATVGRCKCYGPSCSSFFMRWTHGSHRSVAVVVLNPVGVGAGRQCLLVPLLLGMLAPLG